MYLLESPQRGDSYKYQKRVFPKNNMGLSMKNSRFSDFCADRIDVITNFAVIMYVVIKRVHCMVIRLCDTMMPKMKTVEFANSTDLSVLQIKR